MLLCLVCNYIKFFANFEKSILNTIIYAQILGGQNQRVYQCATKSNNPTTDRGYFLKCANIHTFET
jgi:hypothetical protein